MNITQGSWKTTSAGLLTIIGGLSALWFKRHALDEGVIMGAATALVTGVGLLVARDNDKSSEAVKAKTIEPGGTGPKAGEPKINPSMLPLVLVGLILAGPVGCVTPAPGADPLVVQAEAMTENAAASLDAFVQWEYRNRAGVGKDVTAAADLVREYAPGYIRELRAATKAYKELRSQDNADRTKAAMTVLQQLLDTVRNYYQPKVEKA